MTPVEKFLEGTNLGRFQTITFQLRFIGTFSPAERDALWDTDTIISACSLPGLDDITVYFGDDEEVYLSFPSGVLLSEDIYHVHTIACTHRMSDRLKSWSGWIWMRIRNWWWSR